MPPRLPNALDLDVTLSAAERRIARRNRPSPGNAEAARVVRRAITGARRNRIPIDFLKRSGLARTCGGTDQTCPCALRRRRSAHRLAPPCASTGSAIVLPATPTIFSARRTIPFPCRSHPGRAVVVTETDFARGWLETKYPRAEGKTFRVYNGIDSNFPPRQPAESERRGLCQSAGLSRKRVR